MSVSSWKVYSAACFVRVYLPYWTGRVPVWVDLSGTPGRVAWTSSSCLSTGVEPVGPLTHAAGRTERTWRKKRREDGVTLWILQRSVHSFVSGCAHCHHFVLRLSRVYFLEDFCKMVACEFTNMSCWISPFIWHADGVFSFLQGRKYWQCTGENKRARKWN